MRTTLIAAVLLSAVCILNTGKAATADVIVRFDQRVRSARAGQTVIYTGSALNTGDQEVRLNATSITTNGTQIAASDGPFLGSAPLTLKPSGTVGDRWSGIILEVSVAPLALGGTFQGVFEVFGGSNEEADDLLARQPFTVNVDNVPPSTTSTVAGLAGENGWFRGPVTVELSVNEPDAVIRYEIDGSPATLYNGPFVVSNDGKHTLAFWSTDAAGNQETRQTAQVSIDSMPPLLKFVTRREKLWPPSGKVIPVVLFGSVRDAGSGIPQGLSYGVVDEYLSVQPSGTAPIHASGRYWLSVGLEARRRGDDLDGRHYQVVIHVKDRAGNTATSTVNIVVPHDSRE
jgi:hypothetical protein